MYYPHHLYSAIHMTSTASFRINEIYLIEGWSGDLRKPRRKVNDRQQFANPIKKPLVMDCVLRSNVCNQSSCWLPRF